MIGFGSNVRKEANQLYEKKVSEKTLRRIFTRLWKHYKKGNKHPENRLRQYIATLLNKTTQKYREKVQQDCSLITNRPRYKLSNGVIRLEKVPPTVLKKYRIDPIVYDDDKIISGTKFYAVELFPYRKKKFIKALKQDFRMEFTYLLQNQIDVLKRLNGDKKSWGT